MDWWLDHALDGIVGGLVGGLATALAVWLTLRHERLLSRENSAIETAARLFPLVLEYSHHLASDPSGRSVAQVDRNLHSVMWELLARAEHRWPIFKANLQQLDQTLLERRHVLLEAPGSDTLEACVNVKDCVDEIFSLVAEWINDPKKLEKQPSARWALRPSKAS